MDILQTILTEKRKEVASARRQTPVSALEASPLFHREKRSLKKALRDSRTGVVAEFKRKSPSKGLIHAGAEAALIAPEYARAGAAAISVLTDGPFFGGSAADLRAIRPTVELPLLRKDFTVDPYQLCEAKAWGADAILLIAAALSRTQCAELAAAAHELGLEVLLEIHGEEELAYLTRDVDVAGVNNRNLKTFATDTAVSLRLGRALPPEYARISESGIADAATAARLKKAGFDGFLVGEFFMRTNDPGNALQGFIGKLEELL